MTRDFRDSPVEHGPNNVRIEDGRIINVNMRRWTADVRTRISQRVYLDVEWSNPYFHFGRGEGIFFMPEVGARVKVCRPSDSNPFIMCFVTAFERSARPQDPDGTTPQASDRSTDPTATEGATDVSYRAGRPLLQQGDLMMRTRDGNFIWLRRGGVVEIGATKIAKRVYIPLLNYIRDICENYSLWSAGGFLTWTVQRSDTNPEDKAVAVLSLAARDAAQDQYASVLVRIGHVDDTKKLRLVIAPNAIDARTFEVRETPVYTLDIDQEGTRDQTIKKDDNKTVEGDVDWNISGSVTMTVQSDLNFEVSGDHSVRVSGEHSLQANSSTERLSGGKVIQAANIQLGGRGASKPVVLGSPALLALLLGHTHAVNGPSTGPPIPTLNPDDFLARKVTGE